jgi:hypothetical protein
MYSLGLFLPVVLALLFIRYLILENRLRDNLLSRQEPKSEQLIYSQSKRQIQLNIALFLLLLAADSYAILLTFSHFVGFYFLLAVPFLLVFIAIIACIQCSILEMVFPQNSAWYNRFWPNFVLVCAWTLPKIIWSAWVRHVLY